MITATETQNKHNTIDQLVWFDIIRSGWQSLVTLYNLNGDQVGAHRASKELCRVMVLEFNAKRAVRK